MNKKIDNLKEMCYHSNISLLSEMVLDAIKKNDRDNLQKMSKAIKEVAFYVNGRQMVRWAYNKSIEEYRLSKNRAIERARKAEKKIEELQDKLDQMYEEDIKDVTPSTKPKESESK